MNADGSKRRRLLYMALSKEQKRDYWRSLLIGGRAHDEQVSSLLVEGGRAIWKRRGRIFLVFGLSVAYFLVGVWIWLWLGKITFFFWLGAWAVLMEGFILWRVRSAWRVNEAMNR